MSRPRSRPKPDSLDLLIKLPAGIILLIGGFLIIRPYFGVGHALLFCLIGLVAFILPLYIAFRRAREQETSASKSPVYRDAPSVPLPRFVPSAVVQSAQSSSLPPPQTSTGAALGPELLNALEWKRFEELTAAYVHELGLRARSTRVGADGGVDVEVIDPASDKVVLLIQCKAWSTYKVGVKTVRELFGVMAASKITEGAVFGRSGFTEEALAFGRQHTLDLVDGPELISRIRQLPVEAQVRLYRVASAGDYSTPTCPQCGIKMVRRTARKGTNAGDEFWGCRNYPRCKRTF